LWKGAFALPVLHHSCTRACLEKDRFCTSCFVSQFCHGLVWKGGLLRFLFCITVAPDLVWKRTVFALPVLYHSFAMSLFRRGGFCASCFASQLHQSLFGKGPLLHVQFCITVLPMSLFGRGPLLRFLFCITLSCSDRALNPNRQTRQQTQQAIYCPSPVSHIDNA